MPNLAIYFAPRSCSRATLIVLEEIGVPYEARSVAFAKGENRKPEFLAVNPKGKVPALVIDGKTLTETAAIFTWLDATYPDAQILPRAETPLERAKILSDICWVTSALHGLVARLRFPVMFTSHQNAWEDIFVNASQAMAANFALIDERLTGRGWWFGAWSA